MPQSQSQKTVNNFVKGLITEAGELTFPDGASVDELNCDLRRDGSRRRRLAVEVEANNSLSTFTVPDTSVVNTGDWLNVNGIADKEFLVVQKGNRLFFYNKDEAPYSGNQVVGEILLSSYEFAGSVGAAFAKCQFASLEGVLVVASEAINTIYVEYDGSTFTATQINFKVRDFDWQGDIEDYSEGKAVPVPIERQYDTYNAGWDGGKGTTARNVYFGTTSEFPPLTHPWFSGKDASGVFSPSEWAKVFGGTSLTGNGHYILDFFVKDRNAASGLTGLTTEIESSRFKSVTAFASRIFYAGLQSSKNAGTILFSRVIDTKKEFGECHQRNDPTSEYFSDLLDTDGGVIRIPDAIGIKLLYAYQSSLFVFAENGVWKIEGVDGVFKASQYAVSRVSEIGIQNPQSFVEAEGVPFWWSRFGIHTLSFDQVSGQAKEQNITLPTIQTFWDDIDLEAKTKVVSLYDSINKKIYWMYPDAGETVESKLNNILILDLTLQAFIPWRVEDEETNTNCVVGMAFFSGYGSADQALDVWTADGYDVVTSGGDDVISTQPSLVVTGDPAVVLLIRDGDTNKLTFGAFTGRSFLDWGSVNYTSYAETGYDFVGDLTLKKNAPYLTVYCRSTEEGWTGSEETGWELVRPSSLLVSTAWDFKKTFSQSQQVYRLKYPIIPDSTTFDYPDSVITTRLKTRGHGRSMRIRYESEEGKDFILLGWGLVQGRNGRY